MIEVVEVNLKPPGPLLAGFELEQPVSGTRGPSAAMSLRGWIVGAKSPVMLVRVHSQGTLLRTINVSLPRKDIAERFGQVAWAATSGFWTHLTAAELPEDFDLWLTVQLHDGSTVQLGNIRGRRTLSPTFMPSLQPLLITSLGRTGTTWLMRLLSEHTQIVAHRAYPYETRAAGYWMHMLRVLTQPAVHPRPDADLNFNNSAAVSQPPFFVGALAGGAIEPSKWLKVTYPAQVMTFCQQNIESFYSAVAAEQKQDEARFFLEKYLPDPVTTMVRNLYAGSKELLLVRDFRDTMCSILAFNAKRGFVGFGRAEVGSDEEYVNRIRSGAESLLQVLRCRPVKLVQYEELILEPDQTLRGLLDYVGLNSSSSVIEGILNRASRDTAELQGHRTSSDPAASIGRWQDEMPPQLKDVCNRVLGPVLKDLGYDIDPAKTRVILAPRRESPVAGPAVLVVSRGDEEMLRQVGGDRSAWHFPRGETGEYAGFYPADSADAIAHLESLRARGAEWLYFPLPSLWWLDHYAGFREHLESRYAAVEPLAEGGRMFHLKSPVPAALAAVEKE